MPENRNLILEYTDRDGVVWRVGMVVHYKDQDCTIGAIRDDGCFILTGYEPKNQGTGELYDHTRFNWACIPSYATSARGSMTIVSDVGWSEECKLCVSRCKDTEPCGFYQREE